MYKIQTLNSISPAGLGALDRAKYNISGDAACPDAILVRSQDMHDMAFNRELLCIARAGAGTNNIPVERCAAEGIVVFNTPGANAEAVKELALCAMLLASRDIVGGIGWVKTLAGKGGEVAGLVEKGKARFVGPEICGKTLGVVGLGAVGAKIAGGAAALGMRVYGYDPYISVEGAWRLSSSVMHAGDLDTIYRDCDYITLHVPYMEATHHMINRESIAKMKDGVRLINLSRAELVDDGAVIRALRDKKMACYVTDFPNGETAGAEGVIAIPHLGASTPESEDNCARMAAQKLMDYIENGNITSSVNMPAAVMPRNGDPRLCIIHRNIPDMIARITGAVSSCGINIENMLNTGTKRAAIAYTMLDVSAVDDGLEEKIRAIDGVVRVRTIA